MTFRIGRRWPLLLLPVALAGCQDLPLESAAEPAASSIRVASIVVSPARAEIEAGGLLQLEATLYNAAGEVLIGGKVDWSTTDPAVAAVDRAGRVTGSAAGTATIGARSQGVSGAAELLVTSGTTGQRAFYHGAYLGKDESTPEQIEAALRDFTALVAKQPALIKTFHYLGGDFSATSWRGQLFGKIASAGATNFVALDLKWPGAPAIGLLDAILAGQADAAIVQNARQIAGLAPMPLLIEPGWEMNGDWDYGWQGIHNGGDASAPAKYAQAWRRIVRLFRENGATNVRWVFNPNQGNPLTWKASGAAHWNWYANYYPGDEFVDFVGVHGFNGPSIWGGPWRDFGSLFDSAFADHVLSDMAARFPDKPIIVGEFASEDSDLGDKAAWIRDAFRQLQSRPNVIAAIWFNADKETNWRVNSTADALAAYREAVSVPNVVSTFGATSRAVAAAD